MIVDAVGDDHLSTEDVVRVAESIEPVSVPEWEAEVERLTGGPGLRPDPGYDRSPDNSGAALIFAVGLVDSDVAAVGVTRATGDEVIPTVELSGSSTRMYVVPFRPGDQGAAIVALDADGNEVPT